MNNISYKSTVYTCYGGNFVQAIVINLLPILMIPLRDLYNVTFEQLGRLVFINFITQVVVDIALSGMIDRYSSRFFLVFGQALTGIGLVLFASVPYLFSNENIYLGLAIATSIYAGGGGLMELMLSPVVNSLPSDAKAAAMSMLHSFYCWGQAAVITLTALGIYFLGYEKWHWIAFMWSVPAFVTMISFMKVPLLPLVSGDERTTLRQLICRKPFWVACLCICFGAASEVTISQWISTFSEKGLGLNKMLGDIGGVALFAVMMALGRTWFGIYGEKVNLHSVMIKMAILAFFCYVTAAVSPYPSIALIACVLSGLGVCLMWPGTLSLMAARYPLAGGSMFAILAASGDIGGAGGPWGLGYIADTLSELFKEDGLFGYSGEVLGLRGGLLLSSLFPIGILISVLWLRRESLSNKKDEEMKQECDK